jgi:hypothetical protein
MYRLNAARSRALRALRDADTARTQSSASRDLADAMERAHSALAAAAVTPQQASAHAAIVRALENARHGYARMADAAATRRRTIYDAGRRQALEAEAALARALLNLRALGYEVRR